MEFLSETYTDIRQFLLSAARWAWGIPDPLTIEFLPRTYDENGVQPRKRWIKLILRSSRSTWHLKLTFQGTITDDRHPIFGKKPKRRKDLQDLCHCIDFHRVQLLDDTVTEVILALDPVKESVRLPYEKRPGPDNEFFSVIDQLWVYTREDPDRVRFPTFNSNSSIPTRELSDIRSKEELDGHSVYKVLLHSDETPYIYKEIERPHYIPADTEVLEQELYNLELFRGNTFGIV